MAIIGSELMDAFRRADVKSFQLAMVQHLRLRMAAESAALSADGLMQLVEAGIRNSATYGITGEFDVRRYLECMLVYAEDFDRNPNYAWAGQILLADNIDGAAKMDRIGDYELFVLRKAAC